MKEFQTEKRTKDAINAFSYYNVDLYSIPNPKNLSTWSEFTYGLNEFYHADNDNPYAGTNPYEDTPNEPLFYVLFRYHLAINKPNCPQNLGDNCIYLDSINPKVAAWNEYYEATNQPNKMNYTQDDVGLTENKMVNMDIGYGSQLYEVKIEDASLVEGIDTGYLITIKEYKGLVDGELVIEEKKIYYNEE